jgi:hypothetical protein
VNGALVIVAEKNDFSFIYKKKITKYTCTWYHNIVYIFFVICHVDSCGVCDGDDTTCHVVTGSYNISAPEYHRVAVIPAGSTNINIRQTSLYQHSPNIGVGDNIHLGKLMWFTYNSTHKKLNIGHLIIMWYFINVVKLNIY